jgi:starch synthase
MKVIFVSSEIVPFASTGGLGDVCASLPKALAKEDVDVIRMMPLYKDIDRDKYRLKKCEVELHISLGHAWYYGTVWEQDFEGTVMPITLNAFCFFKRLSFV